MLHREIDEIDARDEVRLVIVAPDEMREPLGGICAEVIDVAIGPVLPQLFRER